MPDIEEPLWQRRRSDISLDPLHEPGFLSEPPAHHGQRFTGEIQHRKVAVAVSDQIVGQRRRTAADIDDRGIRPDADSLNQTQRQRRVRLIPADFGRRFRRVDVFPMSLRLHRLSREFGSPSL